LASLGHPSTFQRVSRLGSVTTRHFSSGRQPNFAALNRGRDLYSASRVRHVGNWPTFSFVRVCISHAPAADRAAEKYPAAVIVLYDHLKSARRIRCQNRSSAVLENIVSYKTTNGAAENVGMENAGVDQSAPDSKCETSKYPQLKVISTRRTFNIKHMISY